MSNEDNPVVRRGTALLAGATGLVGGHCLNQLLSDSPFEKVVVISRRPLSVTDDRLQVVVTPLERLPLELPVAGRAALCALGTTLARAGSQEAFRKVDHDGVVAFARWARAGGARTFVLISSTGADPRARTFYLRVKGEAEEAVGALGFPRLVILRPGLLMGDREERRTGERVAQAVFRLVNPIMKGPLGRVRGIDAQRVAAAMLVAAASDEPGRIVWHNDQIEAAAGGR